MIHLALNNSAGFDIMSHECFVYCGFFSTTPPFYFRTVDKCSLGGAIAAHNFFTHRSSLANGTEGFILPRTVTVEEKQSYCHRLDPKIYEIIWLENTTISVYSSPNTCSSRSPEILDLPKK